jgi:hypothetical protein
MRLRFFSLKNWGFLAPIGFSTGAKFLEGELVIWLQRYSRDPQYVGRSFLSGHLSASKK